MPDACEAYASAVTEGRAMMKATIPDMKALALLVPLLAPVAANASGSAPFCVYSSGPPQCFYYSHQSCLSAAKTFNGMCAPNNNPQQGQAPQQPQLQGIQPLPQLNNGNSPGIYEMMRQNTLDAAAARDAAIKRRREQEEHEARMALLRSQTAAVEQQSAGQANAMTWEDVAKSAEAHADKRYVIYSCSLNGQTTLSTIPKIGCIVHGFGDPIR